MGLAQLIMQFWIRGTIIHEELRDLEGKMTGNSVWRIYTWLGKSELRKYDIIVLRYLRSQNAMTIFKKFMDMINKQKKLISRLTQTSIN